MSQLDNTIAKLRETTIAVWGIPYDGASSFMKGPAGAPSLIREALRSGSSNLTSELGVELGEGDGWVDAGDLTFDIENSPLHHIEESMSRLLAKSGQVVALGGDHSITYPVVRAFAREYEDLSILHLDAHPDLYDEFGGDRFSNACPFARIMEEGLAKRLVQVGIRTANAHQREQAERYGVEVIEARSFSLDEVPLLKKPVYLSLDMDVLDPAFAPGVSHLEPGGLTTRDVLKIIQAQKGYLVGADIVEFNPTRDINGITAMVTAKFLKEILAAMLSDVY